jgi:hypothetical protein
MRLFSHVPLFFSSSLHFLPLGTLLLSHLLFFSLSLTFLLLLGHGFLHGCLAVAVSWQGHSPCIRFDRGGRVVCDRGIINTCDDCVFRNTPEVLSS